MKTKLRNLWKLKEYIYNHKIYAILIVVLALAKVSTGLMTIHLLGALIDSVVDRSTNLPALLLSFSFNHIFCLCSFSALFFLNHAIDNVYGYLTFVFTDVIINDVRSDAMCWLVQSYRPFNEEKKVGDILSRLTGDIDLVSHALASPLNNLLPLGMKFIVSLLTLFFWSPLMGWVATALIIPIWFSSRWIADKSRKIVARQRVAQGELVSLLSDVLDCMPVVTAWGAEVSETRSLRQHGCNILALKRQLHTKYMLYWFITRFLSGIGIVFSVIWTFKLSLTGYISAGGIMVAYNYMQNVLTPISSFTRYSRDLHQADVALARIFELQGEQHCCNTSFKFTEAPEIVFEDVYIRCNDNHILKNVNFTVKANSLTVLAGPSGIGKSTLLNAAIGFHPLEKGHIAIGGGNPLYCTRALGISFQRDYLLDRSIRENIAFSEKPSDGYIYSIAKRLGLLDVIVERGLDFAVGIHGEALSGGERRRVALARALYRPKLCYIFDEPTAELDDSSKSRIIDLLAELRNNATILITSHDEDVLAIADQVVYVSDFM